MHRESRPVNQSLQQIDENSWLFGDPLPAESHIQKLYDAGGVSAVWRIGDAICKARKYPDPNMTLEHVTLDYLHNKCPLGQLNFTIPNVIHHTRSEDRYFIIQSRLPGETLAEAWPSMDEGMKEYYVSRVAGICRDLAAWTGGSVCGVDGRNLSDLYLTPLHGIEDMSPQNLLGNCAELGMDCSSFLFYHCDLGPGNIIVGPAERSLGIVDWEMAGFVPREWIRTKVCVSSGLDLPGDDDDLRQDWRRRLQRRLGQDGFPEIADQWMVWFRNDGNQ
ncbi:kinase-like domain-containing protein [Bombardia bombarda]|uniref:Kinase-like domain-containing protein n=1 Tax=Bombardia bombarda TaxID=252184 RepID=A0AA39X6N0_9PEZI|nr:kinase-like domain-containing protein [Bombardia bombarda]